MPTPAQCLRSLAFVVGLLLLAPSVVSPAAAQTEKFPSRAVTIIVPFAPGGGSDPVMRLVGSRFTDNTKQTVIVDNRPAGGGNVGAVSVKQAAPDGYTLFMGNMSTHAINATLYSDLQFDPIKDFQPITLIFAFPSYLLVNANMPVKNFAEFVTLAKQKPGGLSYGSQGVGSGGHILGEMLSKAIGAKMTHVPYRGAAPALTDLVAGQIDLTFANYVAAGEQVRGGRLQSLAIASAKRSNVLPDIPTITELGYPGIELDVWAGLLAPAATPPDIVRILNEEFVKAASSPDIKQKIAAQGAEIVTSTPADFAALIRADVVRVGKVVKELGVSVQ